MSKSLAGSMADAWVKSPQGGELCRRIKQRFREIDEGGEIMAILRIKLLEPRATPPAYATDGAAGLDLAACASGVLMPGARWSVPTGIAVEIPEGYEGQVRPRSGLSARGIVAILGTIDSDYRGEIAVMLEHRGDEPLVVTPGMRIAQLVIAPVARVQVVEVEELSETKRGERGFGSTGVGDLVPDMGPEVVGIPLPEGPITCAVGCAEGHCIGMGAEGCHGRGLTP